MELKDRKFIKNTGNLPGFSKGNIGDEKSEYYTYMKILDDYLLNIINASNFANQLQEAKATESQPLTTKSLTSEGINSPFANTINKDFKYKASIEDPYEKNPNLEPPFKKSTSTTSGNKVGAFLTGATNLIENTIGAVTGYTHKDEILAARDSNTGYVGDIPYTRKSINRNVLEYNKNGRLPKYAYGKNILGGVSSGASAGSALGPWGTIGGALIGGLAGGIGSMFASDSEKEALRDATIYTQNENAANLNSAASTRMQIDNAKKYGLQADQRIYHFNCGKLPKYDLGKVVTPFGQMYGEANAKVSNGEFLVREIAPGQYSAYRVPGIKNNEDGKLAMLGDNDYVISNKNGSSDIAAAGDIEGAINHMIATGNPKYKCGKLPKHAEGWLGNAIPAIAGGLASLGQYLSAKNSSVYRPNTYSENPYEREALITLAGLRINPYPVIDELRKSEARTNRAVDIAGGLSGGQRAAARLANLGTTQNNISKLLQGVLLLNNAYRSSYAQAALTAGQQARTARMQANQWDLDMYSKAHAARNKGIQTGIANMLSQIQQYQANEFKRRQFNDTMALYRDDMDLRKKHMNWIQNNSGLNISQNADPIKNPSSQYWNQLLPSEKWLALYNRGIIG